MADDVKRGYRSDLRAAHAEHTRRLVVAAAAEMFVHQGYGATTVEAVAAAAGVSRKTVFTAVGGKAQLLRLALDWAVAGDDAPVPLAQRPEMRTALAGADPGELLDRWAAILVDIDGRAAALHAALAVAADGDADARAVLENTDEQRRAGAHTIVVRLDALAALPTGLSRREATDIAWLLTDPVLYTRLVRQRGWSAARFRRWLAATLRAQLTSAAAADG